MASNGGKDIDLDEFHNEHTIIQMDAVEMQEKFLVLAEKLKNLVDDKIAEKTRLQAELDATTKLLQKKQHHLESIRPLLDKERRETQAIRKQMDTFITQSHKIDDILAHNELNEKQEEALLSLKTWGDHYKSSTANVTDSGNTDFSYSCSEDDFDCSVFLSQGREWESHRPSTSNSTATKRWSNFVPKTLQLGTTARKSLPALKPARENNVTETFIWANARPEKQHCFKQTLIILMATCKGCDKNIRGGKVAIKCGECKNICHGKCRKLIPLPCLSVKAAQKLGVICDYAPLSPPMIPEGLIKCIGEIERRGLTTELYKLQTNNTIASTMLIEQFLSIKKFSSLDKYNIDAVCEMVILFLGNLSQPIATYDFYNKFGRIVDGNHVDVASSITKLVEQLPLPNRDTLAYIVLHLQRLRSARLGIARLAKLFGPIIVGYSSTDLDSRNMIAEIMYHKKVIKILIRIPSNYWSSLINVENNNISAKYLGIEAFSGMGSI